MSIVLLAALALAPGPDRFTRCVLEPAGRPELVLSDDLDGDGKGDLLFLDGRRASVFFWTAARFARVPDLAFDLPESAVFVDVADRDGDGARELFVLGPEGVATVAFTQRTVHPPQLVPELSVSDPLLPRVPAADVMWNDFILDVDGRGAEDAVLPVLGGYRVCMRSEPELRGAPFLPAGLVPVAPSGDVDLASDSDLRPIRQTLILPRLFVGDVLGDPDRELLTFDGHVARVYARPESTDSTGSSGEWREVLVRELYQGEATFAERLFSSRNVRVADLDGTGRSDLVVVRAQSGEIDFFRTASAGGSEPLGERRSLRLDGFLLPPKLIDLDGDGRVDLLAPVTDPISALSALRVFLSRTFTMRYAIFVNREPARFARTPNEVREIRFPLEYETGGNAPRVESRMVYSFDGDFDGDGRKDFLVRRSGTELDLFGGTAQGTFSTQPIEKISIDDATPYRTLASHTFDLDGDRRADLLLNYQARAGAANRYVVLLSGR